MFGANGQLHVNRVVRGLGHGLDEAAIAAANKMRFKPALRNGQPVDSTAIVHVVFPVGVLKNWSEEYGDESYAHLELDGLCYLAAIVECGSTATGGFAADVAAG